MAAEAGCVVEGGGASSGSMGRGTLAETRAWTWGGRDCRSRRVRSLEGQAQLARRRGVVERGRREPARGQADAEFGESVLGGAAGEVEGADGAASSAGAAEDVGAEGALMQLGPVEAGPLRLRREALERQLGRSRGRWLSRRDDGPQRSVGCVGAVLCGALDYAERRSWCAPISRCLRAVERSTALDSSA
jgi:hypothetical protein